MNGELAEALEPCPFCGSGAVAQGIWGDRRMSVRCMKCDACGPSTEPVSEVCIEPHRFVAQAIAAWNRRAASRLRSGMTREGVARIVDPWAFESWQSLYDYCITRGDDEAEARSTADWAYKKSCDDALAKADAILSLAGEGER